MDETRISDTEDRNQLISILARFSGDPFTLKNLLSSAYASSPRASNLPNSVQLFGASANNVAKGLLHKLELYGSDVDGRHVLALLIDALSDQAEIGVQESKFLSRLVYKYKLIYPADTSNLIQAGIPESYINKTLSFLNAAEWSRRLTTILHQVCRIEVGTTRGSGFLIGSNLVLTNYHVVRRVVFGEVSPSSVVLRFDYTAVGGGEAIKLDKDWLLDYSPDYPEEYLTDEPIDVPLDRLDYALIRLSALPGNTRGWITNLQINTMHDFVASPALFIVQHPKGQPLQIALDTRAIISVRKNGSRVRYRTNTEPGSSGSPCFDQNWNLVALHHSGDRNDEPMWNEGIPVKAIHGLLEQRGMRTLVG